MAKQVHDQPCLCVACTGWEYFRKPVATAQAMFNARNGVNAYCGEITWWAYTPASAARIRAQNPFTHDIRPDLERS